jgi:alpha-glucosidase (family GH31 glycosyl hydrolase)
LCLTCLVHWFRNLLALYWYPNAACYGLEFPGHTSARHFVTQYMLGSSLNIASVFNAFGNVEYYLPEGKWYDVLDGKMMKGPG